MGYVQEDKSLFDEALCPGTSEEISPEIYKLFYDNMNLVYYIAKEFSVPWDPIIDREDIQQEGFIGLWKACLTYDEDKGYQFSTYAVPCIRSQILMMMRRTGTLKLPKYFKDIRKALYEHGFTLPLDPMEADTLLQEGKFSRAQLAEFMNFSLVSLDHEVFDEENSPSIAEIIEDKSARIEYQFSDDEIEEVINKILTYIKPNHRDIVEEWMYAVLAGVKLTTSDLARKYHISKSYVSRLLSSAIYLVKQNGDEIRNIFGI